MLKAILFDLDDTLYPEGDFAASGYRAVARRICGSSDVAADATFRSMMATFAARGRAFVLSEASRRVAPGGLTIAELVRVYREHIPRIRLLPGYGELLRRLRARFRLGVLTDGLPAVQRRKVRSLGLDRVIDQVVCTWDYGAGRQKPHPAGFMRLLAALGASPSESLYVGDNLAKDRAGAANAGLRFVHLCHTRAGGRSAQRGGPPTWATIETLHELPQLLQTLT